VLALVSQLRGEATVFFSSHVLNDVQRVCDRVAIIREGRLIVAAPLAELLTKYSPAGYHIKVAAGDGARAREVLNRETLGLDHVELLEDDAFSIQSVSGDEAQLARRVIPELVREGIAVTEFAPIRPELEEVFVQLIHTRREERTE